MARGLSPLQVFMLRASIENRRNRTRSSRVPTKQTAKGQVVATHMGVISIEQRAPVDLLFGEVGRRFYKRKVKGGARTAIGHVFREAKPQINATISRAARLLARRGLATVISGTARHWSGIRLKQAGIAKALALEVKYGQLEPPAWRQVWTAELLAEPVVVVVAARPARPGRSPLKGRGLVPE